MSNVILVLEYHHSRLSPSFFRNSLERFFPNFLRLFDRRSRSLWVKMVKSVWSVSVQEPAEHAHPLQREYASLRRASPKQSKSCAFWCVFIVVCVFGASEDVRFMCVFVHGKICAFSRASIGQIAHAKTHKIAQPRYCIIQRVRVMSSCPMHRTLPCAFVRVFLGCPYSKRKSCAYNNRRRQSKASMHSHIQSDREIAFRALDW